MDLDGGHSNLGAPAFKIIQTTDQNIQLIQNNIQEALRPIQVSPFVGGTILINPSAASGTNVNLIPLVSGSNNAVQHFLGRTPSIYFFGPPTTQSTIWVTSVDNKFLNVSCSADCSAFIWVN